MSSTSALISEARIGAVGEDVLSRLDLFFKAAPIGLALFLNTARYCRDVSFDDRSFRGGLSMVNNRYQ